MSERLSPHDELREKSASRKTSFIDKVKIHTAKAIFRFFLGEPLSQGDYELAVRDILDEINQISPILDNYRREPSTGRLDTYLETQVAMNINDLKMRRARLNTRAWYYGLVTLPLEFE